MDIQTEYYWQALIRLYPHPALIVDEVCLVKETNKAFTDLGTATKTSIFTSLQEATKQGHNHYLVRTYYGKTFLQWTIIPYFTDQSKAIFICLSQPVKTLVQAAEQARTLQTKIIDLLPNHIFWKDKDSVYLGCNKAFSQALGLASSHEIVGKTDYDLPTTLEQSETYRADDQKIMANRKALLTIEEKQTMSNGEEKTLLTSKVPLVNEQNEVTGILAIYTDISEQKKLEQSLRTAKEQADIANQAKGAFMANMSHDIRTPLTGIIGMASLLKENLENEIKQQQATWLLESGEQLLQLLNNVLDVVSADKLSEHDLQEEWFDINICLQNLVQLEMPIIKLKNLVLNLVIDPAVSSLVYTDRTKLDRILLNLLSNAIKFTDQGSIELKVIVADQKPGLQTLQFSITDTGIGIAKEHLEKIFERFYRISPSYQGLQQGHGVGLHIVKQYSDALGGELHVSSQENKGSIFQLNIPLKTKSVSTDANTYNLSLKKTKPQPASKSTHSPPLLLLVEDNPIALCALEGVAQKNNCQICSTISGEEAFELATTQAFDLIITDIGLPGISGIEFTRQLRQFEQARQNKPTPIVGLTAHASKDIEQACLEAGMQFMFTKPISLEIFHSALKIAKIPITVVDKPKLQPLGIDLPDREEELFALESYPLLDATEGIKNLGSKSFLRELLQLMVDELPAEVIHLQQAHVKDDWQQIEKLAHKLKSSGLYCGTTRLKGACQYLERYQKSGQIVLRDALYQQLLSIIAETMPYLQHWLDENNK